jgi:hypothetical protein
MTIGRTNGKGNAGERRIGNKATKCDHVTENAIFSSTELTHACAKMSQPEYCYNSVVCRHPPRNMQLTLYGSTKYVSDIYSISDPNYLNNFTVYSSIIITIVFHIK